MSDYIKRNIIKLCICLCIFPLLFPIGCTKGKSTESDNRTRGDQIAFVFITDKTAAEDIYAISANGSNLKRLTNNSGTDESPSWSPDGKKIVFSRYYQLCVMNADGTNQTIIPKSPDIATHPAWSPDGNQIAFVHNNDIYVINVDGSELTRLTTNPSEDTLPSWSPDGKQITYISCINHGRRHVYVMNSNGTQKKQIAYDTLNDSYPSFISEGKEILFQSIPSIKDLQKGLKKGWYIINLKTKKVRRLDLDGYIEIDIAPDDKMMVYSQNGKLYVSNLDGSEKVRLLQGQGAWIKDPAWSP